MLSDQMFNFYTRRFICRQLSTDIFKFWFRAHIKILTGLKKKCRGRRTNLSGGLIMVVVVADRCCVICGRGILLVDLWVVGGAVCWMAATACVVEKAIMVWCGRGARNQWRY